MSQEKIYYIYFINLIPYPDHWTNIDTFKLTCLHTSSKHISTNYNWLIMETNHAEIKYKKKIFSMRKSQRQWLQLSQQKNIQKPHFFSYNVINCHSCFNGIKKKTIFLVKHFFYLSPPIAMHCNKLASTQLYKISWDLD